MLYKNECEGLIKCAKCKTPKYKVKKDVKNDWAKKESSLRVLCYLPILQPFQWLYANEMKAKNQRWQGDEKILDGRYLLLILLNVSRLLVSWIWWWVENLTSWSM